MALFMLRLDRLLGAATATVFCLAPGAAFAGWGDENWGELIWRGPALVPVAPFWVLIALALLLLALVIGARAGARRRGPVARESLPRGPDGPGLAERLDELQARLSRAERALTHPGRLLLDGIWASRRARLALGVALLTLPLAVLAGTISKPHTFINGTIADADEVNANFDVLYDESNANDAMLAGHVASAHVTQLATTVASDSGFGQICVTCPASHPLLMGGACEKDSGGQRGFGPSTDISGAPPHTYCCVDGSAGNSVIVTAVCADLQ